MSLIERAAMAIRDAYSQELEDEGEWIQLYGQQARAALAETRNPTPAMIEAGLHQIRDSKAGVRAVWRAMHDAMMKE